jgi:hypothetical protein
MILRFFIPAFQTIFCISFLCFAFLCFLASIQSYSRVFYRSCIFYSSFQTGRRWVGTGTTIIRPCAGVPGPDQNAGLWARPIGFGPYGHHLAHFGHDDRTPQTRPLSSEAITCQEVFSLSPPSTICACCSAVVLPGWRGAVVVVVQHLGIDCRMVHWYHAKSS